MNTTMNLHQPLPSSCYLSNSEHAAESSFNLSPITPKLQKRKQKLHLGSKTKVDPALFQMEEREDGKKMLASSVTDRPRVGNGKTKTKSDSTEEPDSEEEKNASRDDSETFLFQAGSDYRPIKSHSNSVMTHSDYPANEEEKHRLKSAGHQQEYKKVERAKSKLNPSSGDEAQKKFGSAKSISSEKYFQEIDGSVEYKSDLSRFANCTSISSDDLFNRAAYETSLQDLFFSSIESISYEELAASLKNGVSKVAEKLGSAFREFASHLPHEFHEYT